MRAADARASQKLVDQVMYQYTRLIIPAREGSEGEIIAHRLQRIASGTEGGIRVEVCADLETARKMLFADEFAKLCQIYTPPERSLCNAIQQDVSLDAALVDWVENAQDTLFLHRHNRERSILFEAAHFCRYSDVGLARLGFSSGSEILDGVIEGRLHNLPVLGLIAQAQLQSSSAAVELREELDASAQLLSNDESLVPPLSAGLALHNYRAQSLRLAETEHERDKANHQIRATLESLKALKEEAASKNTTLQARETEIEKLRAERDSLGVQLTARDNTLQVSEVKCDRLQTEIESLRDNLNSTEKALNSHRDQLECVRKEHDLSLSKRDDRIAELLRDLSGNKDNVEALKVEIARIMDSHSMRITKPLRHLRAMVSRWRNG